jgi:hypothetical protein
MTTPSLTATGLETNAGKVSLETLAKMTGFPVEMIKEEIFMGQESSEVSLDDLRSAMLSYIDKTMLLVADDK